MPIVAGYRILKKQILHYSKLQILHYSKLQILHYIRKEVNGVRKINSVARSVCRIGIMAAAIECAKLVLMSVPNVEAVTFLIAVFSYVFGWQGVAASFVFVAIEPLLWGFGTWVISYFIYWPLVAVIFMMLGRIGVKSRVVTTGVAVMLTVFFGILTSFVDVGVFSGRFDNLLARFAAYYLRGVVFYLLQIATNAVLFPLFFGKARDLLFKLKGGTIRGKDRKGE